MERMDFVTYNINNFTPEEIVDSGSEIESVRAETMVSIQRLRTKMVSPIYILKNGLTAGKHTAKEHPEGRAIDVFIKRFSSVCNVVYSAIDCGFRGVGVYYNHESGTHTFHFDLGPVRFWGAYKKLTTDEWTYYKLLKDPKEIV